MPVADLTLLEQAARKAGELALTYWGGSFQHWDKPEDAGPVTEADLAVNDLLHDMLMGARPTYGWLSEETQDDATRLTKERCFICLLYTSPSPRDLSTSRMPSSA